MAKGTSITKTAVWILLGLLILGLGGFGATNLSGTVRTIGTVGSKSVSVDSYGRLLQQEIRSVEQQTRQQLPFARVQQIGLDRAVLQSLVDARALDHEAAELGLSVGDGTLRDRILEIPRFTGVDGTFDREGYRFELQQNGLTEAQFETQLREEVARTLLQGAIVNGVSMPDAYVETLMNYVGSRRSFTWSSLGVQDLDTPLETPDDATLRTYYDANIDAFMLPETKEISYALLSPDALLDEVEIDEETLRAAYERRSEEFNQPERRLVERLAFLDEASATEAVAGLNADTTFEALVEGRGLALADIDLGDVGQAELGEAGEAIFAADVGQVVGPLPSPLGPALFRVNASLPAQNVSFEDAIETLRPALEADRAQRLVDLEAQNLDDLLAGGATLEELVNDSDMVMGTISWTPENSEEIAAYEAFRREAAQVTVDDFPEIKLLEDGGVFALRLDEVLAPRPNPFEDARAEVLAAWQETETQTRLSAQIDAQLPQLRTGTDFAELGLDAVREENLIRNDFVSGTPPGFMTEVFEMEIGDVRTVQDGGIVVIVRLDGTAPPEDDGDAAALRAQLAAQADQALAQDIFAIFGADVTFRANPQINPQALQAVHVNFP